jgi:hypothetical protein
MRTEIMAIFAVMFGLAVASIPLLIMVFGGAE